MIADAAAKKRSHPRKKGQFIANRPTPPPEKTKRRVSRKGAKDAKEKPEHKGLLSALCVLE
jgi:hypothetical protein